MHALMAEQQPWNTNILRGHYAYYGLPNNPARRARSIRRSDASDSAVSDSAVRRLGTSPETASLQRSSAFLYRCLGSLTLGRRGRHETSEFPPGRGGCKKPHARICEGASVNRRSKDTAVVE
jgi:hypothetical protein